MNSGDAATAAFLANAYVDAYINTKQDQAVQSLLALTTQLQNRVDALEVQIGDIDAQLSDLPPDADPTDLEAQRRQLVDEQASTKQRLDNIEFNAARPLMSPQSSTPPASQSNPSRPHRSGPRCWHSPSGCCWPSPRRSCSTTWTIR